MQILINIDENLFTRLFDNGETNIEDMKSVCTAVRGGTPLPEGHGDLVDLQDLINHMYDAEVVITAGRVNSE